MIRPPMVGGRLLLQRGYHTTSAMGDDEIIDDDGCTIELDDVLYNNQTVA